MADILYTYKNQVYVNLTNKCDCACTFCIRSHQDSVGDSADTLWHKTDPTLDEVVAALDAFDFTGYDELVYCGYGESTCALDILIRSAEYAKKIRGKDPGEYERTGKPLLRTGRHPGTRDGRGLRVHQSERADSGRVYGGDPAEIRSCI